MYDMYAVSPTQPKQTTDRATVAEHLSIAKVVFQYSGDPSPHILFTYILYMQYTYITKLCNTKSNNKNKQNIEKLI